MSSHPALSTEPFIRLGLPDAQLAQPRPERRDRRERSSAGTPVSMGERTRRWLNVVVALIGIGLTAPLMLIVACLVRLDSAGPAIYHQKRVGICRRGGNRGRTGSRRSNDSGGRVFTIYKFRTMTTDQSRKGSRRGEMGDAGEEMWATPNEQWATKNDVRITRLGAILRASRIDELPQLLNVLKGDMNIVGPRPEQPGIFAELRNEVTGYKQRQKVLPGITGRAQVTLGYDTSIDDVRRKVELDLQYIEKRSALEDLSIMAKTMPVIVFRKVWM